MNPIKPGSDLSVNNQYHLNEMAEAAQQHRLVREANEGKPTWLQRLSARLNTLKADLVQNIQDAATAVATDPTPTETMPQRTPLLGGKHTFEV
jgi:hypothetical protein